MSRTFDGIALGSIELFLKAAETESFVAAAKAHGLSPPAVSRAIGRLEARLGVRLFHRTTRQVSLTDDGRLYFKECREALGQIAAAEDALCGRRKAPAGHLRISAPTTYAHHRLLARMPEFRRLYPEVTMEINVTNRNVNIVEEGFDLAIRLGMPSDGRLVARKLEDATLGIFAAPDYLKENGVPRSLDDLDRHQLIAFERPSTGKRMSWLIKDESEVRELAIDGAVSCSDDVLGCVSLARAGAGLFQIYHFVAADAVKRGELVEVLHSYAGATRPFTILYPENRHLSPRLRALVDFLVSFAEAQIL